MNKKTIKAKIAAALSASMVITMLAPAMPAYAADTLKFDFATFTPSVKDLLKYQLIYNKPTTSNKIKDAGTGLTVGTGDIVALPYWHSKDISGGTSEFNATENNPNAPGTTNALTLTALGLKGYAIENWYTAKENGFKADRIDLPTFQTGENVYYAKLKSDGTFKADYQVTHSAKTGSYVPSLSDDAIQQKFVLEPVQTKAKVIPGYKVVNVSTDNDGDGGKTVEVYQGSSLTNNPQLDPNVNYSAGNASPTDLKYDHNSQYVVGTTTNRAFKVNYKYAVDQQDTKALNVWDVVWSQDPVTHTWTQLSKSKRAGGVSQNPYALQPITEIKPDATKIEGQSGAPARYILRKDTSTDPEVQYYGSGDTAAYNVPVTVVFNKTLGTSFASDGKFSATNLIPAKTDVTIGSETKKTFNVDNDHKVTGLMLNQKVDVTYNYVANPSFYSSITVKYVDQDGVDIGSKVIEALGSQIANDAASATTGQFYKLGNDLVVKVDSAITSATNLDIPIPQLDTYEYHDNSAPYGYESPSIEPTDTNVWTTNYTPATVSVDYTNKYSRVHKSAGGAAATLTVTYKRDANSVVNITPNVGFTGGGSLKVGNRDYDPATNPTDLKIAIKKNKTASTFDIDVTAADLPDPTPDAGYVFDKWQYMDGSGNYVDTTLPNTYTLENSKTNINFRAVFKEDPSAYNTYHLANGDAYVSFIGNQDPKIVNKNPDGTDKTITFADLSTDTTEGTGILVSSTNPYGSNYTVVWKDENLNELDPTTDISSMSGKTFTAYVTSNIPAAVYDPTIDTNNNGGVFLDSNTGIPTISIDTTTNAIDNRLKYVITDSNGNVVKVIPGAALSSNGGYISNGMTSGSTNLGNFLIPGNTYKIYTALPSVSPVEGQPIPTTDVNANPAVATIPVANSPQVTEDTGNSGRAAITIDPATPGTEYAIVDENGNEVHPFTAPDSSNKLVFGDLAPDKTYNIVTRKAGSSDTIADRVAAGAKQPVSTSNLGLNVNEFDVTVVANSAPLPTNFKVAGTPTNDITKLKGLRKGTDVEILAQPLDNNSNVFKEWRVVSSNVEINQALNPDPNSPALPVKDNVAYNPRFIFKMPNGPVKLQAVYDTGTNWDSKYDDNISSGKKIGAVFPDSTVISENGDFRILITKDNVDAATKATVVSALSTQDPYTGIFKAHIVVQKKDSLGNWADYTSTTGDINLDTTIETGALVSNRTYRLYEIATGSNATAVNDDVGTPKTSYPGSFDINLVSGHTYVFGYTKPATYRVTIKDMNGRNVAGFDVADGQTVENFKHKYQSGIKADEIDNEGVRWHYEGLSTDRNNFTEYIPNQRVTEDITLYLFYSNDRAERNKIKSDLEALIAKAKRDLGSFSSLSQRSVQARIDAAQAMLDKVNRKASAEELQAVFDNLEKAYNNATGNNGGGNNGGGSGGSGGGGGGGSSANIINQKTAKTNKVYIVGTDGNWELTDAAAHKWVFKLNSGTELKGWNMLSYNSGDQTSRDWYYFDENGIMRSGWFFDTTLNAWYYLSEKHDGFFGRMVKGWLLSDVDNNWYYLNPENGSMHTGWLYVGEHWYFLNNQVSVATWSYNEAEKKWHYNGTTKPLGAMYQNEKTPDGYQVNSDGVWVQ